MLCASVAVNGCKRYSVNHLAHYREWIHEVNIVRVIEKSIEKTYTMSTSLKGDYNLKTRVSSNFLFNGLEIHAYAFGDD